MFTEHIFWCGHVFDHQTMEQKTIISGILTMKRLENALKTNHNRLQTRVTSKKISIRIFWVTIRDLVDSVDRIFWLSPIQKYGRNGLHKNVLNGVNDGGSLLAIVNEFFPFPKGFFAHWLTYFHTLELHYI